MAHWSPENATRAYLRTIKMGSKRGKEPDVAEFIAALAGGNNAQLMVEVCGSVPGSTTLALAAAAHQTSGRVVCILPDQDHKVGQMSKLSDLSGYFDRVEFATGDPHTLLRNEYKGADFVLVDCKMNSQETIFKAGKEGGAVLVVGYNASQRMDMVPSRKEPGGGHFLPIGEGILVSQGLKTATSRGYGGGPPTGKRSKWIVKVDKCTGEEHVFRVTSPPQRIIQA